MFSLSVCLSRSYILLKWQMILTCFLLHMPAPFFSQMMLNFGLHWSTPSIPNFGLKWSTDCWVSETFNGKLQPNGYRQRSGHNGEPIGNHHRSFEWYHGWPSTTCPLPKMRVPNALCGTNFDPHAAAWWMMSFAYSIKAKQCHLMPNYGFPCFYKTPNIYHFYAYWNQPRFFREKILPKPHWIFAHVNCHSARTYCWHWCHITVIYAYILVITLTMLVPIVCLTYYICVY